MNEIEVIDLVLKQIGSVRIPLMDEDTWGRLKTACTNLAALREALIENREKTEKKPAGEPAEETPEESPEEVAEDVQC